MRQTYEIIADLEDGKEVPYDELKMACLVQSSIIHFYKQDIKVLLKGGIQADMKKQLEYSVPKAQELGTPTWYWKAIRTDPYKWLSDADIPGTEEWKKIYAARTFLN